MANFGITFMGGVLPSSRAIPVLDTPGIPISTTFQGIKTFGAAVVSRTFDMTASHFTAIHVAPEGSHIGR